MGPPLLQQLAEFLRLERPHEMPLERGLFDPLLVILLAPTALRDDKERIPAETSTQVVVLYPHPAIGTHRHIYVLDSP